MNKMRCMRKTALVIMGIFLLLTGCGNGGGTVGDKQDSNKSVELVWYFMNNPQPDQNEVFAKANDLISKKLGFTVKFSPIDPGSYNEKMNVMISAQEPFDICFTSSWQNDYINNVVKGAFLPLDDLLNKYAPKLKESIPQRIWDGTKVKGKIYGVVNYQISTSGCAYWIKKDLVDKYHFDTSSVKNWYDIEPFLKTIKENEPNIIPLMTTQIWGPASMNQGLIDTGVPGAGVLRMNDPNLKVLDTLQTDEYKQFLKIVRDWYQKGYVRSDIMNVKDFEADLRAGKYAVGTEGTIKPGAEAERKAKYGYDTVLVPISDIILSPGSILATLNAISRTSKHPDKAMQLLELVNTDKELYNLLSFGIEGKHYNKISENHIKVIDKTKYSMANWMIGSPFNGYLTEGQADNTWEETKKMNMNAKPSPLLGFNFDREPVKTKIAQVDAVTSEFQKAIETGSVSPDQNLPNFIDKMKKAGADDIRAEFQKQLDQWLKNKQ